VLMDLVRPADLDVQLLGGLCAIAVRATQTK
jgi:hypothetical protein